MAARLVPVLGLFAGGLVHSVLPVGGFGAHDTVVRAVVTAATTMIAVLFLLKRLARVHSRQNT